jgi:hypothetical protein
MPLSLGCSVCGVVKAKREFSKTQAKRDDGVRRCKPCVKLQEERDAMQQPARALVTCLSLQDLQEPQESSLHDGGGGNASDSSVDLRPTAMERRHVHAVYDAIAPHFSSTRHHPWPAVVEFLRSLRPGAVVADIGKWVSIGLAMQATPCRAHSARPLPLCS